MFLFYSSDWTEEVLHLAAEFKNEGVVGIDIAGVEKMDESSPFTSSEVAVFRTAKELGIHRTGKTFPFLTEIATLT